MTAREFLIWGVWTYNLMALVVIAMGALVAIWRRHLQGIDAQREIGHQQRRHAELLEIGRGPKP